MPSDARDGYLRLHPATLPLRLLWYGRVLVVPALVVLLASRGENWEVWALLFLVPAAAFEIFRYLTLRYRFGDDEIVVRVGLLFRNERHIPYTRIQNIDIVQGPVQRLLGVAEARLETASGARAEAELKVLSLAAIEEIRRRVFADRAAAAASPAPGAAPAGGPDDRPLLRLSVGELVRLGIVSNRGMAVIALALGAAWEFDLLERIEWSWLETALDAFETRALILPALAFGLAVLVVLMAGSVAWTIVRFHGFRLHRHADDLRLECGLLTRHAATVPRRRIQFVSMHASVPHRWFDRVTVRVETAGGAGEDKDERSIISRKWFAPMVPAAQAPDLLADVFDDLDFGHVEWRPLAPRARRRMIRRSVVVAIAGAAVCAAIIRPWGAAAVLVLVPLAVCHAVLAFRCLAWAMLGQGIAFRSGVWTRKISATLFEKIQTVSLGETPFDRRWGMATLRVDTAGAGPAGHKIHVPYLERDVARAVFDELAARTERAAFRW